MSVRPNKGEEAVHGYCRLLKGAAGIPSFVGKEKTPENSSESTDSTNGKSVLPIPLILVKVPFPLLEGK